MVMRYAHLAPDYQLAAVERMGEVFSTDARTDTDYSEMPRGKTSLVQQVV
jgi:hypothetical protein